MSKHQFPNMNVTVFSPIIYIPLRLDQKFQGEKNYIPYFHP
jgi:hypothetical protein